MSTITSLFEQAQLAEAAYANFSGNANPIDALTTGTSNFSLAQATAFVAEWSVVSQQPDTVTGFSATVFKNNYTGQYSLAIRGSTPAQWATDFLEDFTLIATDGIAVSQTIDLYNYWQSLTHTGTYTAAKLSYMTAESDVLVLLSAGGALTWVDAALQYLGINVPVDPLTTPYDAARAFFLANGYVVEGFKVFKVEADLSTNLFTDGRQTGSGILAGQSVSVDGHSLGGHLAMAFSRLFPGATNSATAVNGLGFKIGDTNVDNLFAALGDLPPSVNTVGTAFDAGKIENVYGLAGLEFAAMNNGVLQQPGGWDGIYIESAGLGVSGGHGAPQMTDTLAVYNLLANLDSSLINATAVNLNSISNILKAASNVADRSLENTLDAVRKLFDPNVTTPTATNDREDLYKNLNALSAEYSCGAYTIRDLSAFSADQIASVAEGNIAYRYALKELNPFALVGADYSAHNINGTLEIYDSAHTNGSLSKDWLKDRAAMLAWKNQLATEDYIASAGNPYQNGPNDYYKDVTSGEEIYLGNPSMGQFDRRFIIFGSDSNGTETINGGSQDDRLYGMGGADTINGGGGKDWLEGGQGIDTLNGDANDDTLIGGAGDDTLMGGTGNDTYIYTTGDGNDTITDTDGSIQFDGTTLSGGVGQKGSGIYTSADGTYTYAWTGGDLVINGTITVTNFNNNDLGIHLDETEDPSNPPGPPGGSGGPGYDPNNGRIWRSSSPLALDLNGNGRIDDIGMADSTVYFDLTQDGIAEKSGWLAPEDGLLALDMNGNGVVDDRGELFGTDPQHTAFDRLAELVDANQDGIVDANDTLFSSLRVWQDANSDGISQSGELKTLDELGITSINTAQTRIQQATGNGNNLIAEGSFVRNGQTQYVADIEFTYNAALTDANPLRPLDQPPILDSDIYQLPWLRGYGDVASLQFACQNDAALKQAAQALIAQGATGILQNFETLMAKWTGLEMANDMRHEEERRVA